MINLFTLFSGIGSPEQGAFRVYGKHKVNVVGACEFDKFARQSYKANYEIEDKHFHKDVNDLDATQYLNKVDVLVGGSPCQSFSLAGLRGGTEDKRGQLIYQYIRVVDECKPPIIIYENVKGILSIDNGNTIKEFVQALRDIGYHCHYGVVNTKDYGVPQNRERLFLVGFLDSELYHKFHFADKQPLTKRLKDILEEDVDEKYYLSDKIINGFKAKDQRYRDQNLNRVYSTDGIAATLTTMQGGNQEPKIQVPSATKSGYETATTGDSINLSVPNSKMRRGRVGKQVAQCLDTACNQAVMEPKIQVVGKMDGANDMNCRIYSVDGISPTLNAGNNGGGQSPVKHFTQTNRIRKLTPRECFRLQDFPDSAHDKAKESGVSNSQLYKQAGNSMSVNILEMIFNQIEKAKNGETVGLF